MILDSPVTILMYLSGKKSGTLCWYFVFLSSYLLIFTEHVLVVIPLHCLRTLFYPHPRPPQIRYSILQMGKLKFRDVQEKPYTTQ